MRARVLPIYTRAPRAPTLLLLALAALAGCRGPRVPAATDLPRALAPDTVSVRPENVRRALQALAHDSMEGRATATPGMFRAARYLAEQFRAIGLEAVGDSGYFQRVPLAWQPRPGGGRRPVLLASWEAWNGQPEERRALGLNVVGVLRGTDLAEQAVLIDAHYDHLGVGRPVAGDDLYNGADDDASGVVAVVEIARALAAGPRPKRTVVFLLTCGEELGLLGTRWYIERPVVNLERTVANLEIEMIGRPDPLAGGPGRAWLTGYERSSMGESLAAAGIPIVPDPRPTENFFERSDNIAFARMGIPAHTLSSFNLHADYHRPSDEDDTIDYRHLTSVVRAAVRAARLLADGPVPVWKPGGQPAAAEPRP
ncbi:MAG TPA: M20/M25/M40 family metallo-hydrolase [Longimicrobiaceae bacterium]|nr:M20/M25/M40 family metallo-hydrolase [Longimicrobiaceae bacterium]